MRREPDSVDDWWFLGATAQDAIEPGARSAPARIAEGKAAFRRALRLDPDHAVSLAYFANLVGYHEGRRGAWLRLYRHAIRLDPGHPIPHVGLASALHVLGDGHGAEHAARAAFAASRARPHLRIRFRATACLAERLLIRGCYAEAHALSDVVVREFIPDCVEGVPLWGPWPGAPEPRPRRDILQLAGGPGLGDQVNLARYLPDVARAGWRIRLHCSPPLARLFRTLPGVHQLIVPGEAPPARRADAILLHSLLPWRFGTTLETIPPPATLHPDPDDVRRWRERLAGADGLRVGLIWGSTDPFRSLRLADLAPLGATPGVRFFGLQAGTPRHHAAQAVDPPAGMAFEDLGGEIEDFADLAAAMVAMDLIVTVDTGPAHLAGSLGLPTWVLLPVQSAWLYGTEGDATPWYPGMRLFRSPEFGDWSTPVAQVTDELRRLAAARAFDPRALGGMSVVGVRGIDRDGALTNWCPRREAGAVTPTVA